MSFVIASKVMSPVPTSIVTPDWTMIVSALTVRFAPATTKLPVNSTLSTPRPPSIVTEVVPATVKKLSSAISNVPVGSKF